MKSSIRVGILGTGEIAVPGMLEAAREVPEIAIVAVGSRSAVRAEEFAATHGIEHARTYDGHIADPLINAVYIVLPPSMHAKWSIRALDAGKHVLCEKPMCLNEIEARQVAAAVESSGRVFMETFHYRHRPFMKRVRDLLNAKVWATLSEQSLVCAFLLGTSRLMTFAASRPLAEER